MNTPTTPKRKRSLPWWIPTLLGVFLLSGGVLFSAWFAPDWWSAQFLSSTKDLNRTHLDLSNLKIQRRSMHVGTGQDNIPALTLPATIPADRADFLTPEDRVIGVVVEGTARAYPLRIMNWHEVVNDQLGSTSFAVTFCALCDSAVVFDRRGKDQDSEFGVTGLLYNSNALLYDRSNEKNPVLSQLMFQGISGDLLDRRFPTLPVELTTWQSWKERHPDTTVLSVETGHDRDYNRNPYKSYFDYPHTYYPVDVHSDRFPLKEPILGLWSEDVYVAVAREAFPKEGGKVVVPVGEKTVTVEFDPPSNTLRVIEADLGVEWVYSLWFAWYAFYPGTEVFEP